MTALSEINQFKEEKYHVFPVGTYFFLNLKGRTRGGRERKRTFHPLAYFLNACNSQG